MSSDLLDLAVQIDAFCEKQGWQFCIIGGVAVQHWGEQRFTKDVDFTVLTGFGGEETVVDALLENYEARIGDAKSFALKNRVLLIRAPSGMGVDVSLGALPFEEAAVQRARKIEVSSGVFLRLCTAEDLIVMKAFADRPLDWAYVFYHLTPLAELKEQPEIVARLRKMAGQ